VITVRTAHPDRKPGKTHIAGRTLDVSVCGMVRRRPGGRPLWQSRTDPVECSKCVTQLRNQINRAWSVAEQHL
jgi:hypothetical protein